MNFAALVFSVILGMQPVHKPDPARVVIVEGVNAPKVMLIGEQSITTMAPDFPNVGDTFGPQKTLVVLVNLTDARVQTPESATQPIMQEVSDFYAANSYGAIKSFPTTVVSVDLPVDSATFCVRVWNYWRQILALAVAQGADGASPRLLFIHPVVASGCYWCGNASVGDPDQSVSWIRDDCVNAHVISHELGHNFGDWHSHGESCDAGTCSYYHAAAYEYGDIYDVMGSGWLQPMNAFQKWRLGWLAYKGAPKMVTVTASGAYQLAAWEPRQGNPKALMYLAPYNPATGNRQRYWIEYRQAVGLLVHTGGRETHLSAEPDDSTLKDLDPGPGVDYILDIGQLYTSPDLTVQAIGPTSVYVTLP